MLIIGEASVEYMQSPFYLSKDSKSKTVLKANAYFLKRRKGMRWGGEKERHKQTNL